MKTFKQFLEEENSLNEGVASWVQSFLTRKNPTPEFSAHPSVMEAYGENGILGPNNRKKLSRFVQHFNRYTKKHIEHIGKYSGWSRPLNDALHRGQPMSPEMQEHYNNMSSAVRAHQTPHAISVYSGLHWDPSKLPIEDGHHVVTQKAFTSTSLDPNTAESFTQEKLIKTKGSGLTRQNVYGDAHVLHLHVPQGAHGAYIHRQHTPQSETGAFGGGFDEYHPHEYVLHPEAKFEIHPIPSESVVTYPNGSQKQTFIWHGKLVHDGVQDLSGNQQTSNGQQK